MRLPLLVAASLCVSVMGWAQTTPSNAPSTAQINQQNANNYCRIYFESPKGGSVNEWEQGRKKHMAFHKSQNDSWTWIVREVLTGPNTGSYIISTCHHSLKDFDAWDQKMGEKDTADANASMGASQQSIDAVITRYRADLSRDKDMVETAPILSATIYRLKPGTGPQFTAAIRRIISAMEKDPSRPQRGGWHEVISGSELPTFTIVSTYKSWAEYAPLDRSNRDVVEAAYGKEQSDAVYKDLLSCVDSMRNEISIFRPDLSYIPGK